MTDTTDELIDIILEQQETILLLVELIKVGGEHNPDMIEEMLKRGYRIRDKVLKIRAEIDK